MNAIVVVIVVAFVGAVYWLIRNWNATGPTDLWHDDDITAASAPSHSRFESRPDPHIDQPVIAIGYWRGSEDDQTLPDPRRFVDPTWDVGERNAMVAYLEEGHPVDWWSAARVPCAFCDQPTGPGERSDGVYLWPDGLVHALEAHQVRLPGLFVLHVRTTLRDRGDRGAPDLSWLDHHPAPVIDEDWWRATEGP